VLHWEPLGQNGPGLTANYGNWKLKAELRCQVYGISSQAIERKRKTIKMFETRRLRNAAYDVFQGQGMLINIGRRLLPPITADNQVGA